MKLTVKQILDAVPAMQALASTKVPAKVSLKIAMALRKLNSHLQAFEEAKMKAAKEYGTPSEDGLSYKFPEKEKAEAFTKEIEEALAVEVEVAYALISPDDLGEAEIEPQHMIPLLGVLFIDG